MTGSHLLFVHQFGLPTISGLTVTLAELARQVPSIDDGAAASSLTYQSCDLTDFAAHLNREHRTATLVVGLNLHIEVGWDHTKVLARWCKQHDIPLVIYIHDYWPHHREGVAALVEEFGSHLAAITPAIAADLERDGFVAPILPAGIVIPSELPQRRPSPPSSTVGAVGRLVQRKRLADLVAGFCRASQVVGARLEMWLPPSLVFDPDQDEARFVEIRKAWQQCREKDSITIDRNPRLGVDYWKWSVYASASEYEGLSMTPLEALLQGCPVILSDIPPHRAIVDAVFPDRGFQCLFPVGDPLALADLLCHELETSAQLHDLVDRRDEINDLISRWFSLQNTARRLVALDREVRSA